MLASKLLKIRRGQYNLPVAKRVTRPVVTDSRAQSLQIERRTAGTVDLSAGTISGTAVTYNHLSTDLGGWRERIQRGAFTSTLKRNADIACLFSHDTGKPLGRTGSGTLSVWEDASALRWRCQLPDTSAGRDLMASVQRGDLVQCSFGFICRKSDWTDEPDPQDSRSKISVRIVQDAELLEVSPVLWGAYGDGTSVQAERSMFPSGIPAEIRARIKQTVVPASEEAERKRLLARLHVKQLIDSL
jgi:HK97 family phage prohead protease